MSGKAGELIHIEVEEGPPKWLLDAKQKAFNDCSMFYAGTEKPLTESLMSFSWECGPGWNDVLSKMSYMVEALNRQYYRKYRIRCEAEQIKEKFGTLRVYVRVVTDPPAWRMFLPEKVRRFSKWLEGLKIDYGMVKVVDTPRHIEYSYEKVTKEAYDAVKNGKAIKCSNVEYLTDGKSYYTATALEKYEQFHYSPTKHRILALFARMILKFSYVLGSWSMTEPTAEQRIMSKYMEETVEKYIKDAENECYNRCEDCGTQIGDDWSPRCEMKGWISYLCEKCAKKRGTKYIKIQNGKRQEK